MTYEDYYKQQYGNKPIAREVVVDYKDLLKLKKTMRMKWDFRTHVKTNKK